MAKKNFAFPREEKKGEPLLIWLSSLGIFQFFAPLYFPLSHLKATRVPSKVPIELSQNINTSCQLENQYKTLISPVTFSQAQDSCKVRCPRS